MSVPLDSGSITFRKLVQADLPLLHQWLNMPEVSKWWHVDGIKNPSLEAVNNKWLPRLNGIDPTLCFVIFFDSNPIGYIQLFFLRTPEEQQHHGLSEESASIDLYIGDENYLHKGWGKVVIRRFVIDMIFSKYTVNSCIIDPEPENKIAVRAYEKAGFVYYMSTWNPKDQVRSYLMKIERDSFCPIISRKI